MCRTIGLGDRQVTDPADIPKLIKVAEGFYVRQEIDNIAWADLGGYAIAVDALEHPEKAHDVFDAITETIGDLPIRHMLNTHTHYDHVALNGAFERRYGTEIVNQQATPLGADGRWFEGPLRRVWMLPMPGCHTSEDCVVWIPEDRALFVGDIFGWGLIPLTTSLRQQTAELLLATYARLIDFNAAVVIPGHGPLITNAELKRWVAYFRWLIERISTGSVADKSDQQLRAELPPPEDMRHWWRFVAWKHEDSVTKILSAVRRGRLGG